MPTLAFPCPMALPPPRMPSTNSSILKDSMNAFTNCSTSWMLTMSTRCVKPVPRFVNGFYKPPSQPSWNKRSAPITTN
ncbi:Uncharacterised protein [Vibrio cholerae]|nr:Uncharacterised protein [Vibrio cholerae]